MIYAVGLPGHGSLGRRAVASPTDTGGGHFLVGQDDDLGPTFAQVVEELHHQYVIGFSTDLHDGRSHALRRQDETRPARRYARAQSYVASGAGPVR